MSDNPLVMRPKRAALLALACGGPGFFYLGPWEGTKATIAWVIGLFFILAMSIPASGGNPANAVVPFLFLLVLFHLVLSYEAWRKCKAALQKAQVASGIAVPPQPLSGTRPSARVLLWVIGVGVALVVIPVVLFLISLFFTSHHMEQVRGSVRPGMTVDQVLGAMTDYNLVRGFPDPAAGEEAPSVTLSGPSTDRSYYRIGSGDRVSQADASVMFHKNMVAGRDYHLVFTFTPSGYGAHWSLPVTFSPDGRVREVKEFHTWD